MGEWFISPLGDRSAWRFFTRPVEPGQFVCNRCGAPLVACDNCGGPAMCGDSWCEICQPDE
jgi:hypothetical protein